MNQRWQRIGELLPRARLGVQLVVFESLLICVVGAGAFFALSVEIRAITQRFFAAELARTERQVLSLQHRSLEQLVWTSSVLTQSPTLRAAIETYRLEAGPPLTRNVRGDLLETIQREVERIASGLGKDLLVVTDARGRVLAASERLGARPAQGSDLAGLPVVHRALDPNLPANASNFGVARFHGEYFQIGCVPILLQDIPIGTLILGERLDGLVAQLHEAFAGEGRIIVASQGHVVATTDPTAVDVPELSTRGSVHLGGEDFVAAPLQLGSDSAGGPVVLYLLHSVSAALEPLNGALRVDFLLYGALAVVLAGIGAVVVSRSVTAPLSRFVGFMETVGQTGDYSRSFDSGPAAAEVRTLHASYERLIASLAQEHAELEQRTTELTAQMQERERAEQALHASEAQLRQSQKLEAIGTLAGGVAHDFNNLLTVIHSYTDLVLHDLPESGRLREDLEQVRQAAVRATALTKQLLAFSRKQVMQPRVLDLNTVVAGVEKMLRRVIGEDIDLQTVKAPTLSRVLADPGQLEQVIMNLAVNARDAMPRGGRLTITTADVELAAGSPDRLEQMPPGGWVLLTVSDTGTGMDEQTRARIFEPFFTTKEAGKGTGLGLSTVYGIVKQSNGFIIVASAVGRGTAFRIYFPPVAAEPEAGVRRAVPASANGSETILLVEDEEAVRSLAYRCLSERGYRVLVASRAEEAERAAAAHRGEIRLLLTDVIMPGASGRELADKLVGRHPGMRVLYMSGYTDGTVTRHGVLDPGVELIEKPFTPATLAERVRGVLDR